MGAKISSLTGADSDKDIKENLNILLDMAQQKLDNFEAVLKTSKEDQLKIPLDKELNTFSRIDATVTQDSSKLSKEINDTLGDFVHGKILEGVSSIISGGIKALLGKTEAGSQTVRKYLIFMTKHGGIERLDYEMYKYTFSSEKMMTKVQNVLMITYAISAAEIFDMNENEVISIIDNQYGSLDDKAFEVLKESVVEIIKREQDRRRGHEIQKL